MSTSPTLSVKVSAYYSDGTTIFLNEYSGWVSPKTFVSTSNGTVYLRVAPYYSSSTGTFAIVYSTNTNKPIVPILPDAPTWIDAYDNAPGSITITWNTVPDATGYRIYRSTSSSGSFSQVGSSTSSSYTDKGLSNNTTYYYRITAYNSNGESSQSETVSATTSNNTWTNVTSLAQINGTWKSEGSYTYTYEGITQNQKWEIIYIINASTKTVTMSGKQIMSFSGSGSYFNSSWNNLVTQYSQSFTPGTHTEEYEDEEGNTYTETYTVTVTNSNGSTIYTITYPYTYPYDYTQTIEINESTHTITQSQLTVTQTLTNEDIMLSSGIQINQNGTKMRSVGEGTIMTFTKQ